MNWESESIWCQCDTGVKVIVGNTCSSLWLNISLLGSGSVWSSNPYCYRHCHMDSSKRTPGVIGFSTWDTWRVGTGTVRQASKLTYSWLWKGCWSKRCRCGLYLTLLAPAPSTCCTSLSPLFLFKTWGSTRFVIITGSVTGEFKS